MKKALGGSVTWHSVVPAAFVNQLQYPVTHQRAVTKQLPDDRDNDQDHAVSRPLPMASRMLVPTSSFIAQASARPSTMQLVTISAM